MKHRIINFDTIKPKNKSALLLGCGPSVNLLTPGHITNVDTWALNNFPVHKWLVPGYLRFEVKWNTPKALWFKNLMTSKADAYKNTIYPMADTAVKEIEDLLPSSSFIATYPEQRRPNPDCLPGTCSLGLILSLITSRKYETIYMIGVDLYTSEYFWTGDPHIPSFMQFSGALTSLIKNKKAHDLHDTVKKNDIVNKICRYIDMYNVNVINLSPKSLFAERLPTQSIKVLL